MKGKKKGKKGQWDDDGLWGHRHHTTFPSRDMARYMLTLTAEAFQHPKAAISVRQYAHTAKRGSVDQYANGRVYDIWWCDANKAGRVCVLRES